MVQDGDVIEFKI
ncbi:TPA: hypothetical protein DEW47_02700 [Patescibacteria group bacterium]|nr:hypothetical protein [Patescibacteria group bacterium]HCI04863.1 hypothetical protein [Patescibacteria group bacterium]